MNNLLDYFQAQEGDPLYLFWGKHLLVAALIFLAFWLLARVVRWFLVNWGPRLTSFTSTDLDDRILLRITPPAGLVVTFTGLYLAVKSLPLPEKAHVAAAGSLFIANMILITNIAYRAGDEVLRWYGDRLGDKDRGGLDRQIMPLVEKVGTIFLITMALIITLKHFNYDILSLVTALGIGSLAIGMAAKDTLAHVISGFTIMVDRPFRIGDRIQLKDGSFGDVFNIGLRSTKIKTIDNTLLIIPNSDLCNSTVINMAFPDIRAKGKISVGIAYGSDVELVKRILMETALEIPEVLREPAPEAFFTAFGDSALQFMLIFWVESYTRVFPVTDQINTRLNTRLAAEGINIPFPTHTVYLHKEG